MNLLSDQISLTPLPCRSIGVRVICSVVLSFFLGVLAQAGEPPSISNDDWPGWLGPQADGISRETGWSYQWPKDGPRVLWKKEIGKGYSSFATVDKRVLTTGHRDGQETVYCLDAVTGEPIWEHTYRCELVNNLNEGGPCATPTIEGEFVYTNSRGGHLFCLKLATGDVVWKKALREETGVSLPEWGFSSSPVIRGDRLFVESGRLVAFDKRTGEKLWQTKEFRVGYGSPALFTKDGRDLVATLNNDNVLVAQIEDGQIVAQHDWKTSFATNSSTPIILEDQTLFISTGYKRGCTRLKLTADTLEPIYESKSMNNHFNQSILWNGFLYGIDGNSHNPRLCQLNCIDAKTGKLSWSQKGFGCGSVLIADCKLVILSDEGMLTIAEVNPEKYKELASARILDWQCWTVPVLSHGRLFARTSQGSAVCLDLAP